MKTVWTRLRDWLDASDLPVYREIGLANGNYYVEVRQALRGVTLPPMLLLTDDGKQIVSHAVPIQRRNAILGVLLLSSRPGEIDEILDRERWVTIAVALMALSATLMASLLLARTIAGPMGRLSAVAEQVSQRLNSRARLPDFADRRDEVGQMAGAFARMTSALYRRIEASEKFAADVAHELKNPLAAARGTADVLTYAKTDAERRELVAQIQGELKRLNRLITDVSNASRLDAELARQQVVPVDVKVVLANVVDVFKDILGADTRALALDVAGFGDVRTYVVNAHEGRIGQVVTNLIDNALSFSPAGGTVTVRLRRVDREIELAVEDEGLGIPPDKLETIFERFYSDRPQSDQTSGKNSGLGLSISREIVTASGGRIWAENSSTGGGARFVVRLPAVHRS
ncbi:MAG: HAMP domain-containing protein [Sphingomonadales bacterium]|nr:HAMP domain-containing protein [Sphingomonadales bacterium]